MTDRVSNHSNNGVGNYLWTPDGVDHTGVNDLVPVVTQRPQAQVFEFEFRYKGQTKIVQVAAHVGASRAQVEDLAAKAAEEWIGELNQQEWKRPPTEDEKKQIGKIMNDFREHAIKRRESTTGKLHFGGIKGLN